MEMLFESDAVKETNKIKALHMSDSHEWYTPQRYVEAVRAVLGEIDIDPASCEEANRIVQARCYYDVRANGFDKDWTGRIWLNPPYGVTDGQSNQRRWAYRLIAQYEAGVTQQAILLINAVTGERWFQRLWDYLICFTDHRIHFYTPRQMSMQPTHGNAFVYLGKNEARFIEVFSQFGRVAKAVNATKKAEKTLWEEVAS